MNVDVCQLCGYNLNGSRYTLVLNDLKSSKVSIVGHDECTLEAVNKIKSYKNYQKLSISELLKRLNVDVAIESH